jgi:3-methyladenine DNA glycosylase AlkD
MDELIFPLNPENAQAMAKYMRNRFPFLGVAKPERAQLEKPYLKVSQTWPLEQVLQTIETNYQKSAREYQYYAIDLALKNVKRLQFADLVRLLPLFGQHSWWDSVDAWRKVYSDWVKLHPEDLSLVHALFFNHQNFWYRRVAITLQLGFKHQTDCKLLSASLLADRTTAEFFIQKAIGWSLRDYSKTNPAWVTTFLAEHELSPLATREAQKYLNKKNT